VASLSKGVDGKKKKGGKRGKKTQDRHKHFVSPKKHDPKKLTRKKDQGGEGVRTKKKGKESPLHIGGRGEQK